MFGRDSLSGGKGFFIAEIGINHNGSADIARRMIDAAADIGADAVKFQALVPEKLNSVYTASLLEKGREVADSGAIDFFKKFILSESELAALKGHADRRNIVFFSSVFDHESLEMMERLGAPLYKIASSEITNLQLIESVARCGKPVILSTGISTDDEIAAAVEILRSGGVPDPVLLHCVSNYPLAPEEVNLKRIISLRERFHLDVGFSDHTDGIHACAFAACYGARIFEKHFMPDAYKDCPDSAVSLTPERFSEMMSLVHNAILMTGGGAISCGESEKATARAARRSLFARRDIPAGTVISADDLIALRPGVGISPAKLAEVAGKRAKIAVKKDSMIRREHYD